MKIIKVMVDFGQQSQIVNIKCSDDTRPYAAMEFCRKEFAQETVKNISFFDEVPYTEADYTI